MKKMKLVMAIAVLSIGFTACNTDSSVKKDTEALSSYVDSVFELTPNYTREHWAVIDNGYHEKVQLVVKNESALSESEKAKVDASEAKYEALKAKYELNIQESEAAAMGLSDSNPRFVLRSRLFREAHVGNDMQFLHVTGDNILSVYQYFVDVVADNRDEFSREDWDEIKVLYEALGTRKNVVENNLAASDNRKIAQLKIKFAAINATNRGPSKVTENREAKK